MFGMQQGATAEKENVGLNTVNVLAPFCQTEMCT